MADVKNFMRGLLGQGLGLGWGDEAEAWLRSKLEDDVTYDEALERINREYSQFATENPYVSAGSEFVGGALPMVASMFIPGAQVAAPAVAARNTATLARLAQNPVIRGMVTGMGTGAVAGAGTADPGSRGEGALVGGTIGTVVGGGAPVVIRGGGAGYNWLRNRLNPSDERITQEAANRINEALRTGRGGEGMTGADAALTRGVDESLGVPTTLANTDPALAELAETAAQRGRGSAQVVEGELLPRAQGSRQRVYDRTSNALGGGKFYDEEVSLVDQLRTRAGTLYDDAYAFGGVNDPRITEILQSRQFRSFYDKAREIADAEALAARLRGEDPSKYMLDPIYIADDAGNITVGAIPDVRTLDYIKRGIDAVIDKGFDGQGLSTAEANALRQLRREYINVIDDATIDPDTGVSAYRTARANYAGDMEVLDALRLGREKFKNLDSEQITQMMSDMSQAEKDAFRTGALRNVYDIVMKPAQNINAAQRLVGSPEMQAKLKPLFESEAMYNLYVAALEREMQLFQQTGRILAGSQTARRSANAEAFEASNAAGEIIADTVGSLDWSRSLSNFVARAASRVTMTDEIAERVSRLLMSSEPDDVAAAVQILEDAATASQRGARQLGRGEAATIMGTTANVMSQPESNVVVDPTADLGAYQGERSGDDSAVNDALKALEQYRSQGQ